MGICLKVDPRGYFAGFLVRAYECEFLQEGQHLGFQLRRLNAGGKPFEGLEKELQEVIEGQLIFQEVLQRGVEDLFGIGTVNHVIDNSIDVLGQLVDLLREFSFVEEGCQEFLHGDLDARERFIIQQSNLKDLEFEPEV